MALLKSFSKDTLLYGVGNALKKFIGFLLLPFYSKAISPEEYGIVETISSFTMLLTIFISFQVVDAGSRYYYEAKTKEKKGEVLYTVFILSLISVIPSLIIAFFSEGISNVLFSDSKYTSVIFISIISIPLTIINDEQSWIYRYKRLPMKFNIYILSRSILNIVLGLILVLYLHKGILGIQTASLFSSLIVAIFSFALFTRHEYTFKFNKIWAVKMLKFSAPLIVSVLLTWGFTLLDRFLLLNYKSSYDVGIYSIGSAFARPISIINMAIGMSFYPFFMSIYEKDESIDHIETKQKLNKIWDYYLIISMTVCGMLSVFGSNLISTITTVDYLPGAIVIPVLVLSGIMRQSVDIMAIGMFLKEKTIHYTWLIGCTTLVSIVSNIFLIPILGVLGAAISNLVSTLFYFVICYAMSQRFFLNPRPMIKPILYLSLTFAICFVIPYSEVEYNVYFNYLYKALFFMLILISPLLFKMITINYLKKVIKSFTTS